GVGATVRRGERPLDGAPAGAAGLDQRAVDVEEEDRRLHGETRRQAIRVAIAMIATCELTPMLVGRIEPSATKSPGSSKHSPRWSTTPRRGSFEARALP